MDVLDVLFENCIPYQVLLYESILLIVMFESNHQASHALVEFCPLILILSMMILLESSIFNVFAHDVLIVTSPIPMMAEQLLLKKLIGVVRL